MQTTAIPSPTRLRAQRLRTFLVAAVAVSALATAFVGNAFAANLVESSTSGLLAIYGTPGSNAAELPVGGGLARNFGFGQNMLFQAGNGVGTAVAITLNNTAKTKEETGDATIGATLTANKTGANNPLGLAIQFADFQDSTLSWYSDTYDRPWLVNVCSPAEGTKCKTDPLFNTPLGSVKIEDVSFDLGPGTVIQGTIWGKWVNGSAKVAPCITLEAGPPENAGANQTLIVTQVSKTLEEAGIKVGTKSQTIQGKFCLISANNAWYKVGTSSSEPALTITNE
jgi:hypothetical protein